MLQVHHDMTPDELRRVFHVDSHDQGTLLNIGLGHHTLTKKINNNIIFCYLIKITQLHV